MNRIILHGSADFTLLPKPKYKIGQFVYFFEYNTSSQKIGREKVSEINYDINYFNNGYREAFDYKITYILDASHRETINEEELYSNAVFAIEAYNSWRIEEVEKIKQLLTKNIEEAENAIARYKQRLSEL